jgi:short-subunit dehydrogenase
MKRILITGASRGIGRAIAVKLAASDATLFLHGRDQAALDETAREVRANHGTSVSLSYDLSSQHDISELIAAVSTEPVDVLVNNAGIAVVKPFDKVTIDEWQTTIAVNVTAPFLLTQKLAPRMKPGGSIVNILSVAAKTGFAGWSTYCMSKFALEGWSQSVREELRAREIRVINIYPAATDTDIWKSVDGDWPRNKMISANEVADAVAFALTRPSNVVLESITLGSASGNL